MLDRQVHGLTAAEAMRTVHGDCDPRFAEVRLEFERSFRERGEVGASVCVIHEGRRVVDLWGGAADEAGSVPWTAETMVVVFSCTKAATALCAHILAARGELALDDPVKRYWPEFGKDGKDRITMRMVLSHQAGLPGLSAPVVGDELYDFDAMVRRVQAERPLWAPGTRQGYHAVTFGWLVGEVVRRVSGQTVGTFFRENVAGPLGLDFWIGLPISEEHRVATTIMPDADTVLTSDFDAAVERGEPIQVAVVNSLGGFA